MREKIIDQEVKDQFKDIRKRVGSLFEGDPQIWIIFGLLVAISIPAIYSSTGTLANKFELGSPFIYVRKHLSFLVLGFVTMVLVSKMNLRYINNFAFPIYLLGAVLLFITLIMGVNLNQASRWVTVPLVNLSFQPSELAKIALVNIVAKYLAMYQTDKSADGAFWYILSFTGLYFALVFTQNLSTALLMGLVVFVMMCMGRISIKRLIYLVLAGIFLAGIFWAVLPYLHRGPTWKARIERFFVDDGVSDSAGDYQAQQAEIAVSTGGMTGVGPGKSIQRSYLPHPYSDFIYAIIIEEYGLVGAIGVLSLFFYLLIRIGLIVNAAPRTYMAFLPLGLGLLICLQAYINVAVAVGMIPVTGQTLPIISMGGSSGIFTCISFGIILNVSRTIVKENKKKKTNS